MPESRGPLPSRTPCLLSRARSEPHGSQPATAVLLDCSQTRQSSLSPSPRTSGQARLLLIPSTYPSTKPLQPPPPHLGGCAVWMEQSAPAVDHHRLAKEARWSKHNIWQQRYCTLNVSGLNAKIHMKMSLEQKEKSDDEEVKVESKQVKTEFTKTKPSANW